MASKRKRLTLKEKFEILCVSEKEKLSLRILAERFKISKTQVGEILRSKEEIRNLWITNSNENTKNVKLRKTDSSEIDTIIVNWFTSLRSKNIPISGPLIQEKALEVAKELGVKDFKASNGWLAKFRFRHNISFKSISGEAKSVDLKEVEDWNERLITICEGYEERNIYNADETGLFYRIFPNKTLCFKKDDCIGEKMSKERLTILLCCNALGEFETPLIIGKSLKPRCFPKNIQFNKFGVVWRANKKAWMTLSLMIEWLTTFDNRMKSQNRKVLLFLDNATSHPTHLKLDNVKIIFFPPNTTSVCQPLDQGVIHNCKVWYRKHLLRHIISQLDSMSTLEHSLKLVNVLDAITWISSAVKNIKSESVRQCFRKAGFVFEKNETTHVSDLKEELSEISELMICAGSEVNVENFIKIDDELPTEEESADVHDYIPFESLETHDFPNDEESDTETEDVFCNIENFQEAAKYCKHLQNFFVKKDDSEGLKLLIDLKLHIEKETCNRKQKQTLLTDFFVRM